MHHSMIFRGAIARLGIRPYPLSLSYELTWRCNLESGIATGTPQWGAS
jgi:hypothetical protein